jgi:putative ATP-dependent endonuclease of OLD family
MARLSSLTIRNFRSIEGPLRVTFPLNSGVALFGENNTGKSNIVKALSLVLGPSWPSNYDPEDHEFYNRDRNRGIVISAQFDAAAPLGGRYTELAWRFDPTTGEPSYLGWPNPFGRPGGGFVSGDDRDTCVCIALEAERNLKYQLSYGSKYTLLSKLMHKFHKLLNEREDTRDQLEALFAEIKAKFSEIPEFTEFTTHLRTHLGDFIGSMTHHLEVDFEAYNPTNFFHALRLSAQEDGAARTLDEMGTGEEQILAMSFAYAYANAFHGGIVLVVEEPEAHLHPLAQQWLARKLSIMCQSGLQMLITTHSPHFIDLMALEGLALVFKVQSATRIKQLTPAVFAQKCIELGAPPDRVNPGNILPFYRASATPQILEGLFAKLVLLVEGPTEALSLPVYLDRCGFDHSKNGVAIVPVHGKGSLGKWKRLFAAFDIPVFLVFDNDAHEDRAATKRLDALASLGIAADQAIALAQATGWIVGDEFALFGSDFETVLRAVFEEYSLLEAEARVHGIDAKPFIARWVAERLPLEEADPRSEPFRAIISRLHFLLAPPAAVAAA